MKSRKTAGLIEVEFKSKRSAWAEGIEPLPWVPASVERVAAPSLLAFCIQGIFSIVKLLPHLCKRKQRAKSQALPEVRAEAGSEDHTPRLSRQPWPTDAQIQPPSPTQITGFRRNQSWRRRWGSGLKMDIHASSDPLNLLSSQEATQGNSSLGKPRSCREWDLKVMHALLIKRPCSPS